MKILILSHGDHASLEGSYQRAFEALGHEVAVRNPMPRLEADPFWRNRGTRRLFERAVLARHNARWFDEVAAVPADLAFVGKGTWALPSFWRRYKAARPGTALVCYNADDPLTTYSRGANRRWITELIGAFDLYCTYKSALVGPLERAGARRVARIPFAWDSVLHPAQPACTAAVCEAGGGAGSGMGGGAGEAPDLVFVGNADAYREAVLTAIVEHPAARSWRIEVHGLWPRVASAALEAVIHRGQKSGPAMARIVAGARLNLNILRRQNEGSHNMRTFETPGCGGLMASQYSAEQHAVFPAGEAAVYFPSAAEAGGAIAAALADPARLTAMRARARAIVARHTYRDRARALLAAAEGLPFEAAA